MASARSSPSPEELRSRARALTWLLTDVDGVLTDGRMYYGADGEELKVFNVRDGLGLKMAQRGGLRVGLLSARGGPSVERRARELGLDAVLLESADKLETFGRFLAQQEVSAEQVAYIGDDLPDLQVLAACGLSFCPSDAARQIRETVHHVLERRGGRGAVREAVETVLRARADLDTVLAAYLPPS